MANKEAVVVDELMVEDRRRLPPEQAVMVAPPEDVDAGEGEEEVLEEDDEEQSADEESAGAMDEGDAEELEEEPEAAVPVSVGSLRSRLTLMEGRRERLREELARSEAKEADMVEALETMRSDLIEGTCSADEIALGEEKLASRLKATAALREAHLKVSGERESLASQIAGVERETERVRQAKAARKLHREADEALRDFIAGVADLLEPLRRRVEVMNRCRGQFPLTSPPRSVRFEDLVAALDARLELRAPLAVRFYLLRLVNGPLVGAQVLDLTRARELGIEG